MPTPTSHLKKYKAVLGSTHTRTRARFVSTWLSQLHLARSLSSLFLCVSTSLFQLSPASFPPLKSVVYGFLSSTPLVAQQ